MAPLPYIKFPHIYLLFLGPFYGLCAFRCVTTRVPTLCNPSEIMSSSSSFLLPLPGPLGHTELTAVSFCSFADTSGSLSIRHLQICFRAHLLILLIITSNNLQNSSVPETAFASLELYFQSACGK